MGMEDSAGRRVDVGEVEIDRGRGIVRAMRERERAVRLWDGRVMQNSDGLNSERIPECGGRWCGNSSVVKEGEWLVEWSGMG